MLDANKSELTGVVFSESGDSLLRKEAVTLDKEILRALDFVQYDDSTFIIPDYSGNNRFCFSIVKGNCFVSSVISLQLKKRLWNVLALHWRRHGVALLIIILKWSVGYCHSIGGSS